MSYGKRDDDIAELGIFDKLDKTTVLQEARAFNRPSIKSRECRKLLTKILYLLYIGEPFAKNEATELFFNVTKLFQSRDTSLRQMMFLVIKELSKIADDVLMVTQSLIKDIQTRQDTIYRANAIRALCLITDPSMIQGIERVLKESIVDKNPSVSSAALVSAYHLFNDAKDIVRRWANEVQEAVRPKSPSTLSYMTGMGNTTNPNTIISESNITQYHALGLLYMIRQHDRMAINKLVQNFSGQRRGTIMGGSSGSILKNPAAICLLIRYACKVMEDDPSLTRQMYELLDGFLKHKSDAVNLEAARAICDMPEVSSKELFPAISVLQLFLSSPNATIRFAAIRTLNKLSQTKPAAVSPCNIDMENLVTDTNRSVSTFAITTLLRTVNETSVDRLMKQITGFVGEISDDFKIIVIDAIRTLCLKFPTKQTSMLSFLSGVLRDEGGYEFKKSVVEAMFDMIKFIPESKDTALSHLCEFIEDCEFTKLSVRVLHVLGVEGPKTATPTKFIRYIYNRVILEHSVVRAAAVSALAKFGVNVMDIFVKNSVRVLLSRCLDDSDDEVRDRATFYLSLLDHDNAAKKYIKDDSTYALPVLERQLQEYMENQPLQDTEFNLQTIPVVSRAQEDDERRRLRVQESATLETLASPSPNAASSPVTPSSTNAKQLSSFDQHAIYAEQLAAIPEFSTFGPLFKSSNKPIELTESVTEYVVHCIKHTFQKHIVFQFNCTNTLRMQILENVQMIMEWDTDEGDLVKTTEIPAPRLEYNVPGVIYVGYERASADDYSAVSFTNTLKFIIKDYDPDTGEEDTEGDEDEYQVEDIELQTADYIRATYTSNFAEKWDTMADNEEIETFALDKDKAPSLEVACTSIIDLLSMQAIDDSAVPKSKNMHTLYLAGTFLGGALVLARCRMTFSTSAGVAFELAVRSEDANVSEVVISAIA